MSQKENALETPKVPSTDTKRFRMPNAPDTPRRPNFDRNSILIEILRQGFHHAPSRQFIIQVYDMTTVSNATIITSCPEPTYCPHVRRGGKAGGSESVPAGSDSSAAIGGRYGGGSPPRIAYNVIMYIIAIIGAIRGRQPASYRLQCYNVYYCYYRGNTGEAAGFGIARRVSRRVSRCLSRRVSRRLPRISGALQSELARFEASDQNK